MINEDATRDFAFDIPEERTEEGALASLDGGMLADGQYGMPNPNGFPALAYVDAAQKPAEERLAVLLEQMSTQKPLLLSILSLCAEPTPVEAVHARIAELQKNRTSVFGPESLCGLLEGAGALERVDASGNPVSEGAAEAAAIVEDGVEYLAPAPRETAFWRTTEVGAARVAADDPRGRLHELMEADSAYIPIYRRILGLCAEAGGMSAADLGKRVDGDPLLQNPRFYATKFVDRLERAGGLEWKEAWSTTEEGKALLEELGGAASE